MDNGSIKTERLRLVPLTAGQLALWAGNVPALEKELRVTYGGEAVTGEFASIVRGQIPLVEAHPAQWLYHTFWLAVRPEEAIAVGSLCFKGGPDDGGSVEIGYGIGPCWQDRGYATEAAVALCGWALAQQGVKRVRAETEKHNAASQRVVQKIGMTFTHETSTAYWWAVERV